MLTDKYKKSSFCFPLPGCVEVKFKTASECGISACVEIGQKDGNVMVKDSKNPNGPTLSFDTDEWNAFIKGAKAGEFDIPS